MEALPHLNAASDYWAQQAAQTLQIQRQRVREFLAGQRERLRRAEIELAERCQQAIPSSNAGDDETEEMLAEKDRRIAELEQLLREQRQSQQTCGAVDAESLRPLVDADAVVQQERESLAQLKQQWEEKLRHAEVELSVERAKIARQQAEIAEKLRLLEHPAENVQADATSAGRSSRGRWRARLGLKDPGEK